MSKKLYYSYEPNDPRKYMATYCPDGAYFLGNKKPTAVNEEKIFWQDVKVLQLKNTSGEVVDSIIPFRLFEMDRWDNPTIKCQNMNGLNPRLMRLADVYLMYAEIWAEEGNTAEAAKWVNEVRKRANHILADEQDHLFYSAKFTPAPVAGDFAFIPKVEDLMAQKGWDIKEAIRHERMIELVGSDVRRDDLIRWGSQNETERAKILKEFPAGFNWEKNRIWPIPVGELQSNFKMKPNAAN
jgi:hypothetical protein